MNRGALRKAMTGFAVALIGAVPFAAQAAFQARADGPRVAAVLFLSRPVEGALPFDAAALHTAGWDALDTAIGDRGPRAACRADMEPHLERWGVRTSALISDAFLKEVADSLGVGELLVCDLLVYADRVLLCARSVRTASDRVVWADAVEQASSGEGYLDAIRAASRRILELRESCPPAADQASGLFLVPVRTQGLEEETGRLATYCLLRALVRSRAGAVEDPAVTFARLREAGIDPGRIDGRARATFRGASARILVGDLVSYGINQAGGTPAQGEFAAERFDEEETSAPAVTPLPDISMSLRFVDAGSGAITFGGTEYLQLPPAHGLFGVAKNGSVVRRMQPAADRLVHAALRKG